MDIYADHCHSNTVSMIHRPKMPIFEAIHAPFDNFIDIFAFWQNISFLFFFKADMIVGEQMREIGKRYATCGI
ncbi:MAG: hypothetical protein ABJH63_04335 [Rhizobiaceae bacterium]